VKIPVLFSNGTLGVLCGEDLDEMLEKKLVVAFQRTSGLAIVGRDELRSNRGDGSGSWKNRKINQQTREKVIFLPQRTKLLSCYAYEMTGKKVDAEPREELPVAVNRW
jgi:hypothetical protein